MFDGHQFIKLINDNWVLDITDFTGYKVKVNDDGKVDNYKKAFDLTVADNEVSVEKYMRVPVKVLKLASSVVAGRQKEYEEFQQSKGFYI